MSAEAVQVCRDYLATEYQQRLGLRFASAVSDTRRGRQPVWRTVSNADLTTQIAPTAPSAAGVLRPKARPSKADDACHSTAVAIGHRA
jgi:hypothetical protein